MILENCHAVSPGGGLSRKCRRRWCDLEDRVAPTMGRRRWGSRFWMGIAVRGVSAHTSG
jgi:hypothetical protein